MCYSLLLLFSTYVVICKCLSGSPVGFSFHFNCCGLLAKLCERLVLFNLLTYGGRKLSTENMSGLNACSPVTAKCSFCFLYTGSNYTDLFKSGKNHSLELQI